MATARRRSASGYRRPLPRRPTLASWATPLAILAAVALILGLLGAYANRACCSPSTAPTARWYRSAYASILQETPYAFPKAAELTDPATLPRTCRPNRGRPSAPLFLINHWVTTDLAGEPAGGARVAPAGPRLRPRGGCAARGRPA